MAWLVSFSRGALRQITAIGDWWRENRGDASAVAYEIARVSALLQENPFLGHPVENARRPGIRCYYMESTGHHLFYRVDQKSTRIVVVGCRHERRRPLRW